MNKKKEDKECSGYIVFKQVYLALDRPCYATKLNVCLVLRILKKAVSKPGVSLCHVATRATCSASMGWCRDTGIGNPKSIEKRQLDVSYQHMLKLKHIRSTSSVGRGREVLVLTGFMAHETAYGTSRSIWVSSSTT